MAINLVAKYADKLANAYTHESFLKGKTSKEWKWDGAHSVEILSIVTQTPGDYNRSAAGNRYGTPAELQDTKQTVKIEQDKSFSIVIDAGNNTQQMMLKKAGEVLKAEVAEQMVPLMDKYALLSYAIGAGQKLAGYTSITKSNVLEALTAIETAFEDEFIPQDGRYVFMKNSDIALFRQSLTGCDGITDRILLKGVVGKFGTLNIVGIPTSWMPAQTNAIAFQSKSVVLPEQITSALIHENPQGYNGNVLEGRYLFDAAVVKAYEKGVVVLRASTSVAPGGAGTKTTNHENV